LADRRCRYDTVDTGRRTTGNDDAEAVLGGDHGGHW